MGFLDRVISMVVPAPAPGLPRTQAAWHGSGKVRPAVLLWALGIPIPLILLVVLLRGCM